MFVLVTLSMMACRSEAGLQSPLFEDLFRNDTTAFRGLDPRDPLNRALRQEEEAKLRYQDELGLAYQYPLGKEAEIFIDYHSNNLMSDETSDQIVSIVSNILLEDEVETARLYNEIQAYFNSRYGVSSGTYGQFKWTGLTRHSTQMEILLNMSTDRKGLTINFVDIDPSPLGHSD
ncbi:MAG: hypothetical protein AAF804_08670 [Bacteroidota bacterium]